ncbi:hypothetical protein [Fredinandcohnia sp. 179-A 10B2 NHS]|uniref:hypothetical protein n=1 Tax=Fredinandcohnia sp. 179-A 10B2 NHS TaxID=3235176 RepID=UPI0039A19433
MLDTLAMIGDELNSRNIKWGVGGSLLLHFHGLVDDPNDVDILVSVEDVEQVREVFSSLAVAKEVVSKEPFRTRHFSKYTANQVDFDVMGGFAIEHSEGVYELDFGECSVADTREISGVEIPLCSLEDWFVLYWLIPGKQEKVELLEAYFHLNGLTNSSIFEKALKQPLSFELKERIINLLK